MLEDIKELRETNVSNVANGLLEIVPTDAEYLFICVGTDRSTGDSYGPFVGLELSKRYPELTVFGSLYEPVHAANLAQTIEAVNRDYPNHFVIGVDASLGNFNQIGVVRMFFTPLKPGTGVNKTLPEVGRCHISGIVNVSGFMEYSVLQNTRLALVYELVSHTLEGIDIFMKQHARNQITAALEAKLCLP